MNLGMEASTHIHDVSSGEHEGIDPEAMRSIPVLKPPKRSFCPKCGSDIHANTMLQWRKWRDSSGDVVSMQLEASMETALIQVASHYLTVIENIRKDANSVDEDALRKKLEKEIRKELEAEFEGRSASIESLNPNQRQKRKHLLKQQLQRRNQTLQLQRKRLAAYSEPRKSRRHSKETQQTRQTGFG